MSCSLLIRITIQDTIQYLWVIVNSADPLFKAEFRLFSKSSRERASSISVWMESPRKLKSTKMSGNVSIYREAQVKSYLEFSIEDRNSSWKSRLVDIFNWISLQLAGNSLHHILDLSDLKFSMKIVFGFLEQKLGMNGKKISPPPPRTCSTTYW